MKEEVTIIGKVSVTVDKDYWDGNKFYERLTIVRKNEKEYINYISRQDVPPGIDILNREYWIPFSSLNEECQIEVDDIRLTVSEFTAAITADNTEFKETITSYNNAFKNDISKDNETYKTNLTNQNDLFKSQTREDINAFKTQVNNDNTQFKNYVTTDLERIHDIYDGGRADTKYGGARVLNCGGADANVEPKTNVY